MKVHFGSFILIGPEGGVAHARSVLALEEACESEVTDFDVECSI